MSILTAAVVLVGALCLLDLLLTLAVIRRLREYSTRLERLERRGATTDESADAAGALPAPGRPVGPFSVTTVDGERVSLDGLADHTVVVFLAPECADCRAKVPELLRWAEGRERERTLVIIDGQATDPADLTGPLRPVATVVVVETLETFEATVIEAFGVSAFPSFCVVAGGKVVVASLDFSRLPAVARA